MTQRSIIFSRQSLADLDNLAEYIASDSAYYADQVVDDLYAKAQILLTHLESGRVVPEIGNPLVREVFEHSWRIIYTTEFLPVILVLRIIHFAQDFRGL